MAAAIIACDRELKPGALVHDSFRYTDEDGVEHHGQHLAVLREATRDEWWACWLSLNEERARAFETAYGVDFTLTERRFYEVSFD